MAEEMSNQRRDLDRVPVRGSLRLTVATSSAEVKAGSDFSIFVVIQNPFDAPITVYQVETHIPIELIDVNGQRLDWARGKSARQHQGFWQRVYSSIKQRLEMRRKHTGIAIAVGTDFNPETEIEWVRMSTTIESVVGSPEIIGIQLNFPENPSTEELDRIFSRIDNYRKGLIPVQLQPGDSVVKQFVLRTRSWLFFTPLTHKFQIQVRYSIDGFDHTDTVSYEQSIRSTISAMSVGSVLGAVGGTLLKGLTDASIATPEATLRIMAASVIASVVVVIAFARKSTAQPIVSVEDFWGGALIGFSTGFFGFEQFFGLFS